MRGSETKLLLARELWKRIDSFTDDNEFYSQVNNTASLRQTIGLAFFSARCGSSYLVSLLNEIHGDTLLAGEFLAPDFLQICWREYGWNREDVIRKLLLLANSGHKIFWKSNYRHFRQACEASEQLSMLTGVQKKIFRIKRKDIVSQVLSLYNARKTGVWQEYVDESSTNHVTFNKPGKSIEEDISHSLAFILECEARLEIDIHTGRLVESLIDEIYYEDIAQDPIKAINSIEDYLEIPKTSDLGNIINAKAVTKRIKTTTKHVEDEFASMIVNILKKG